MMLFPTCQVRVVRFYVSLFSFSFLSSSSFSSSSSSSSDLNHDLVSSVWHAGPQPRSCEFSVACRTPTASSWVQCGVPDPNSDPASSVWRAGPQPRSREFSVACRTSTAILRVQCGVPDPNRELVSSVWREREDWSDSLAVSTFAWHAAHCLQCARLDFGWRCAGWFASCWWLGGWWLVARHICYADACPQTGKSHSTGHDCPSGRSFTQRAPCLSSRIDWQVGSQRCFHVGALAELASVWLSANFLTSYSAFGFNRLSAERSVGIRDGWTLWGSTDMFDAFCLSYWYVDRWYPGMIWHVWCRECF